MIFVKKEFDEYHREHTYFLTQSFKSQMYKLIRIINRQEVEVKMRQERRKTKHRGKRR